ncbi:Na+/H+ antiporter NhaC family protein [Planctomycetaceae bacterium SH139]
MDYPWLSIVPPLIAIGLAIASRQVILSLGMSIIVGAILLTSPVGPSPVGPSESAAGAIWLVRFWQSLWFDHLWPALQSWDHQRVFIFSLTLGAMVGVIEAAGGMEVLVRQLMRRVKSRRAGQGLVWGLGLGIFFDDYANTLLLGTTMRSTADRLRFSRAKLAYLVDSTAAPVAGLALVSTWVATEISLIGDGLRAAGVNPEITPFTIFLASIPYRFYAILALLMVAFVAWSGRDFGPMLTEERRCLGLLPQSSLAGSAVATESTTIHQAEALAAEPPVERQLPGWLWLFAVIPVVVCVLVVLRWLVQTGQAAVGETQLTGIRYWGEVLGNADSYQALVWGSVAGLLTAIACGLLAAWLESATWAPGSRGLGRQADFAMGAANCFWGAVRGAFQLVPAMMILWFAWSLSSMTDEAFLNTGGYLADKLQSSRMPEWFLPSAVFVTSGFVALSTGTSWGTMAILTPISIKLAVAAGAVAVGAEEAANTGGPLLLATVGAVLAGAIFGDHCSPISDTTVLSSRACGCDHILHVRTQLPYAMLVGGVSILLGTIPSGLGFNVWWSLVLGTFALLVLLYVLGRRGDQRLGSAGERV